MGLLRRQAKRKVLACGSRGWTDRGTVREHLELLQELSGLPPSSMILFHGGARGADTLARNAAVVMGWQVRAFKADWEGYGKSAGYRRNLDMLRENPDVVIAFWDGASKGTDHTVREALKRSILTIVVRKEGVAESEPS